MNKSAELKINVHNLFPTPIVRAEIPDAALEILRVDQDRGVVQGLIGLLGEHLMNFWGLAVCNRASHHRISIHFSGALHLVIIRD